MDDMIQLKRGELLVPVSWCVDPEMGSILGRGRLTDGQPNHGKVNGEA